MSSTKPHPLEILEITQDSFRVNSNNFNSVLQKVGSRPFVLYSINGATNTGKSFALNYLLKFWEAKKHHVKDWMNFDHEGKFVWGTESDQNRTTVGINIWSEPYFVEENDEEVAILFMDSQGLFDSKSTERGNAIIFSLSTLCSSVSIFNVLNTIDESILQRLQFYAGYAHFTSEEDKTNQIEGFEKLLLLVRDFEETPSYKCGYHDMYWTSPPSVKNICLDTFVNFSDGIDETSNVPDSNPVKVFVRNQILECYKTIGMYLMPHPGPTFFQDHKTTPNFKSHIKAFVELISLPGNLSIKRIGGQVVTGLEFQKCVEHWAKLCAAADGHFPKGQTSEEANAIIQNTLAYGTFTSEYENQIRIFLERHPDGVDLSDSEFCELHAKLQKEALEKFFATKKPGDETLQAKYGELLLEHTTLFFETNRKLKAEMEKSKGQDEKHKSTEAHKEYQIGALANQKEIEEIKMRINQTEEKIQNANTEIELLQNQVKSDLEKINKLVKKNEVAKKCFKAENPGHPASSTIKEFIQKGLHAMLDKIF